MKDAERIAELEAVEVVGYAFFHVDHGWIFRNKPIYEGNPSLEAFSVMRCAQHKRILAESAAKACPAGEPVMWVNPNVIGADMKINWPTAITFSNRGPCHNWTLPLYTHPAASVPAELVQQPTEGSGDE